MEITIHEEKISHFTFHGKKKGPITSHENTIYHPHSSDLNVGQYQKVIKTSGYVDSTEETEAGLLLARAGCINMHLWNIKWVDSTQSYVTRLDLSIAHHPDLI